MKNNTGINIPNNDINEENLNISNKTLLKMPTNILPKYMVPSNIIIVDQFPMNKNNKVDKKMLQEMYLNNEL